MLDPNGATAVAVENVTREEEALPLSLIAPTTGLYRLEINLRSKRAASGRYEVGMEELRSPQPEDEKRIAAEKAYSEGERLRARGSKEFLHQALAAYETALPFWHDLDSRREIANTLMNIGEVYFPLGEVKKTLQFTEQALPIRRELGDRRGVASALHNIAVCYNYLGDGQKALQYYNEALLVFRELSDLRAEASTLNGIGGVYSRMGEEKGALDSFSQALAVLRSVEEPRLQATILNNVGNLYLNQGPPEKALEYLTNSLSLRRTNGDRRGEGITIFNLAIVYSKLGQVGKALEHYDQALSIAREVGDRGQEARVLNRLGLAYLDSGDPQKALNALNQGVPMARDSGDREAAALGLFYLARVERATGNLIKAKATIEAAIELTDATRTAVAGQDLRASFFATVRKLHDLLIDVLMQLHQQRPDQGFDAEALYVSERARARSLLEMLNEENVDIRQGVEPILLERERSLQASLISKNASQMQLLGGKHTEAQATAAENEIQELVAQYRTVQAEIRAGSPHYAALTQPQTLTPAEIQREVLDPNTLLLEYALGEDRSYVWAVTTDSLTSHALPKREEIESAARRLYDVLTTNVGARNETLQQIDALSRMVLGPLAKGVIPCSAPFGIRVSFSHRHSFFENSADTGSLAPRSQ